MSQNYHTPVITGAAATAAVVNDPLGDLDAGIGQAYSRADDALSIALANRVEVEEARFPYTSLDARLDSINVSGGNVSTQANGAASAGQTTITVDSTEGFLPGAPISYTLVGGVIETNTIATVTPTTTLTVVNNIGTGGIGDNTFIMVINLGALISTGAVDGATAAQQRFVKGAFLGGNASLVGDDSALLIGRSAVNPLASGGSHAVRDESTYYYAAGGYASFDSNPEVGGASGMNHVTSFQARPNYGGVGTIDAMSGMTFQPTITGPVTDMYGLRILDALSSGDGAVEKQWGIYIAALTKGTSLKYGIFIEANTCHLGGGATFGGSTPITVYSAGIVGATTNGYGLSVVNPTTSAGGTITNLYGLFISTLTFGSATNYGVYVEGNQSYFGGTVRIDGSLFHNGSTAGFFGTAAVSKPTGVAVSAAGIHAALVTLGLIAA